MGSSPAAPPSVVRLLAEADHLAPIVAGLHARALEAAGARRSVLLELEAGTDRLRPTSATGFDDWSADAWLAGPADAALVAEVLANGNPRQVAPLPLTSPELALRLETPAAILAPVISAGTPLGLLVLGVPAVRPALEWAGTVMECAAGFAVALARARLQRDASLQHGLDDLIVALARSGTPSLPRERLEGFCGDVARLFAADQVALWSHERRARLLDLVATSDGRHRARPASIPTADAASVVAIVLRHSRAGLAAAGTGGGTGTGVDAVVPLRGRRRALGVLVLEGIRISPGDEGRVLDRLDGLGRQFANLLESAELLGAVLRATRELEHTFDSMQELVLVCSSEFRVTRANEAAARRFGRSRGSLDSCVVTDLVGAPLAKWLAELAAAPGGPQQLHTAELDDIALGGTFRVTVTPLANAGGEGAGWVLVAHDVSEERRLESERAALREQLAQSEAMTHLVAGIAHELNNPLQAALGHMELLRRTEPLPPRISMPLRQIYRQTDRAARIVRNLLFLAGSGHIVRRMVSVNAAVRRAIALCAGACRRAGIAVDRQFAENLPLVPGDSLLLQQALHNVILNAEQALTDGGGRIEVRTGCDRRRRRISITVRDTGPGFEPAVLPRVFDPYFTTRNSGSGLGLAIARRIIQEHGGEIDATNHPEGGAVFTVHLPVSSVIQ